MDYLAIMWISGLCVGYPLGFFMARMIYRSPDWPAQS